MLKLNNIVPLIIVPLIIVPLIIFHWLWDFVLFAAPLLGEQTNTAVNAIALLHIPIEIIVGTVLWLQTQQVPERAIA